MSRPLYISTNNTKKNNQKSKHKKFNKKQNYQFRFINNYDEKKLIVDYLFDNIPIAKLNYKIIKYEDELSLISEKKFFIQPNYVGSINYLIFAKIMDRYYSVLVDKKTLGYSKERVNIQKVRIMSIKIRLNKDLYNGSVFEGNLVNDKYKNNNFFVINDVLYFNSLKLVNEKIYYKNIMVESFFDNNKPIKEENSTNIDFIVNDIFELNEIDGLIKQEINN